MGGGGGGSGYFNPALVLSATLYAGTGTTPGNNSDPNRGTAGNAGAASTSGSAGKVIVKYAGTPIATGGTITQSGGFTFHTFTSSGTLVF
jgi:hypothetical protein